MPRKIYDIKPPKISRKVEKEIKAFVADGRQKTAQGSPRRQKNQRKKERRHFWVPVSVGIFAVLFIACIYLFFKLPKADIVIWPKVDTLSFQQTITADKSLAAVDIVKGIIPAQYFQATKTNSQSFPATGNASDEGRASGNILLYNKYDPPTPLTLKAGTHFMSDSERLFITFQKVVIPAAKKSGSKITPGSVQIQVQAVEGGADYNIAPANFSVPWLKGTAYYYSIYAVSTSAMTGGYTGKVKKVTADDIQQAKDTLADQTTSDAISALKNQVPSDYILLDSAIVSNVTNFSAQAQAGTIGQDFNCQATVTASALAFKKSDLEKFAKDYIISQMPEGKTLLDSSFVLNYSVNKIDISDGAAILGLDFAAGVYQSIDKNSVSLSLLSQDFNQVQETMSSRFGDQVLKTQTNFWPFWVKSVPKNQKSVNIELKF